jgi:hypothetical protein
MCKNKKKEWLDHKMKETDDGNKHKNVTKFYRDLKNLVKNQLQIFCYARLRMEIY